MTTPADSAPEGDKELYEGYSVDDEDQLTREDILDDDDVDDELDRGYSPPERYSQAQHYGTTPWEEEHRETIDQRLVQEQPDADPYEEGDDYDDYLDDGEVGDA